MAFLISASQQAVAQEKAKSLLELLFPGTKETPAEKPKAKAVKPKPKAKAAKPRNRTAAKTISNAPSVATAAFLSAPAAPVLPAEKLLTAKKILVVGDFLASGTAEGLSATFEQSPGVVVVGAANGSSGLVRDDFYNWPSEIGTLIATEQPAIVVVMIGANDRQQLLVSGKREEVRSPAWLADYRARVRALANAVTSRNIPLVWIGQVPFRSNAMTADMLALNDIFRETTDTPNAGAAFVDIWEGFVDETGKFVERGPDVNGQIVALRSGQVNVTKAGYRKIAFYAERSLNRLLGDSTSPQIGTIGEGSLPTLSLGLPGIEANLERMRPINLLDASDGDALLGASVQPLTGNTPRNTTPVPSGRIDDLKIKP
ncbi:MAG: SGNH/GDSL hydrolase family protein [Notoacmeibacter sp.]